MEIEGAITILRDLSHRDQYLPEAIPAVDITYQGIIAGCFASD
jgi:hypothetical protein